VTGRRKVPTWTSLVTEQLRSRDDFMSTAMLQEATKGTVNQISAACFHLRAHRVIDVVVNPDGKAWWYALPKESDDRLWSRTEIAAEIRKRTRKQRFKAIPLAK
jgi:Na+-translocating ferredoxin:NAD+ oxidoreductase RnfC subunit